MSAKFPQAESDHACCHPDCCPHETGAPESAPPPSHRELSNRAEDGGAAVLGTFKRWLLWFLTFFGIYASSSMCPFCGTPGCPVGSNGAALVGGFFAALWQSGKNIWERLKRMVAKCER